MRLVPWVISVVRDRHGRPTAVHPTVRNTESRPIEKDDLRALRRALCFASLLPDFPSLFRTLTLPAQQASTTMSRVHLQEELLQSDARVTVETRYGSVRGGRAANGAAVFLGAHLVTVLKIICGLRRRAEVPYALPPERFADPQPLPAEHVYEDKDYILESSCACFHPL